MTNMVLIYRTLEIWKARLVSEVRGIFREMLGPNMESLVVGSAVYLLRQRNSNRMMRIKMHRYKLPVSNNGLTFVITASTRSSRFKVLDLTRSKQVIQNRVEQRKTDSQIAFIDP